MATRENPPCGRTFESSRSWQRFCSDKCRYDYHRARSIEHDRIALTTKVAKENDRLRALVAKLEKRIRELGEA